MRYVALLSLILFLSACKKDLRSKEYVMDSYNNSGITGTVTFIETKNENEVTVRLQAEGLETDTIYLSHLHEGTPGNLTATHIYFNNLKTSTGSVTRDETWDMNFDDALNSNTCFTIHRLEFFSNDTIGYVLAGGTGRNGK